jgi:hypothetical protein
VIGAGAQLIEDVEAAFVAATQHHARLLQQEIGDPSAHRLPSARELDLHVLSLFRQIIGPFIQELFKTLEHYAVAAGNLNFKESCFPELDASRPGRWRLFPNIFKKMITQF